MQLNSFSGSDEEVYIFVQGALVMPLMSTGFSMGLVKFNLITARKP